MAPRRAAFVTGLTGQDGSYLAELLLAEGYVVYGLVRRSSNDTTANIRHLLTHPDLVVCHGDLTDMASLAEAVQLIERRGHEHLEVYNLAAQSHVHVSFEVPLYTAQVDALGALNLLEVVRRSSCRHVRFCQASSSEMFGAASPPQRETTPFHPRSPYGVSKVFGYWAVRNYREAYGMFACSAISFNHESERRGHEFVTRKITLGVARIAKALRAPEEMRQKMRPIELGNLDAKRDWSHAQDVVRAMWTMLQQPVPDDYVVASGEQHSVREFAERSFAEVGYRVTWRGAGADEVGVVDVDKVVVRVNPALHRPAEVESLLGDSAKLRAATGWEPTVSFDQLVKRMVAHDYE